jgi:hypothetical protein
MCPVRDVTYVSGRREALLAGTNEEPALLHPNMAAEYRRLVRKLAEVLNRRKIGAQRQISCALSSTVSN